MYLGRITRPKVESLDRETVFLIPTGSIEQHGRHLPLGTDTLLVSKVAEAVEARLQDQVVVTPPIWLGASGHHLDFAGTLSAQITTYMANLTDVIESLARHRFRRFFVLNGHGGNTEPNSVTLRAIKERRPDLMLAHMLYASTSRPEIAALLEGPTKEIRHACEAETSLMLHLYPDLVHMNLARDDGLEPHPPIPGLISTFRERTEEGSYGYASLATAEKGRLIFEACVRNVTTAVEQMSTTLSFVGESSG